MVAVRKQPERKPVVPKFCVVMLLLGILHGKPGFGFDIPLEPREVPPPEERHLEHSFSVCPHLGMLAYLMLPGEHATPLPDFKAAGAMFTKTGRRISFFSLPPDRVVDCRANDGHDLGCNPKRGGSLAAKLAINEFHALAAKFARHAASWFGDCPEFLQESAEGSDADAQRKAKDFLEGTAKGKAWCAIPEHLRNVKISTCHVDTGHPVVAELTHRGASGVVGGWLMCVHPDCCHDYTYGAVASEPGGRVSGMSTLPGRDGKPVRLVPIEEALKQLRNGTTATPTADTVAASERLHKVARSAAFKRLRQLVAKANAIHDAWLAYEDVMDGDGDREIKAIARKKAVATTAKLRAASKAVGKVLATFPDDLAFEAGHPTVAESDEIALAVLGQLNLAEAFAADSGFLKPNPFRPLAKVG